jgi:DegV family protein with EDD domain
MAVAVVTDSTCYLPRGVASEHAVRVVPVQVIIGGQPYDETDDDQAQRVADALAQWQVVTTSRPSPERFTRAIVDAQEHGADGVVIATLSAALSATYESALLAAKESSIPVTVVDSGSIAMGLGFAVLDGADAAARGASLDRVAEIIRRSAERATVLFYVDTLEYLRRGGRVSAARAAVGQALQVKPLLRVADGRVEMFDKVRTAGKALARLAELAVEAAQGTGVRIAVQHLAAPERADALAAQLRGLLPQVSIVQGPVGGVVGAHVGPGMVAVVVSPAPDPT